jgi:hypothetical protein
MMTETLTEEAAHYQRGWREAVLAALHASLMDHTDWIARDLRLSPRARDQQVAFADELCSRIGEALPDLITEIEKAVREASGPDPDRGVWLCVLSMPVDTKDRKGIRVRYGNAPDRQSTLAHHLWHRVVVPSLSTKGSARPFSRVGQAATVAWEAARGWLLSHPDVAALTQAVRAPDAEGLCRLARQAYWRPIQILIPVPPEERGEPAALERLHPGEPVRNSPQVRAVLRGWLGRLRTEFGFPPGRALRVLAVVLGWRFPLIWPARVKRDREGRRVRDYVREVNLLRRELKPA